MAEEYIFVGKGMRQVASVYYMTMGLLEFTRALIHVLVTQ
jgi:hypothetical protein